MMYIYYISELDKLFVSFNKFARANLKSASINIDDAYYSVTLTYIGEL
jgi:hypothetical protein